MTRSKRNVFFEEPLAPILTEKEQWLADYHINSEKLAAYMLERGAKKTAYSTTVRCLNRLRNYLLQNGIPYSGENAIQWLDTIQKYPDGYRISILRLSDLYLYGEVQPVNAFPHALPYEQNLNAKWKSILYEFMDASSVSDKCEGFVKRTISRFLYGIQKMGIENPSDITYDLLETYCQNDGHSSHNETSRYTYAISDILLFMADKGLCEHGLGWYPYYRMHDCILRLSDLSDLQVTALEHTKIQPSDLSAEEFVVRASRFVKDYKSLGYSPTLCKVADYTLHNLLLFMEMHGLGYHETVINIWLEHEKTRHKSDGWKSSRRILKLFELYVEKGVIRPEVMFNEKPLLCESLPSWCRIELDSYMALKIREGWKRTTLNMIRSSVTRFCNYLVEKELTDFSDLTPEILKDFNLCDPHITAEGKNAYNSRIRKFLKYLERKEMLPYGLHMALNAVAAKKETIVTVLTEEELELIKKRQQSCTTSIELRDKAMMSIGLRMGLRASDIVTIRLSDIDWKNQTLRLIQEKTDNEVLLPIPTDVANAIYLYIKKGRPNRVTAEEYLFTKNYVPHNSLNRGVCTGALRRTLPDRKVPGSGFHVTRRTYATDRLVNGVGKQALADLLGHKDTQSLNRYLQLDEERMRKCPLSLAEAGLTMEGGRYETV